jgi:cell wall assembly regulator SMI1
MDAITSLWRRLEVALSAHVPQAVAALQKGASEATVRRLEATLGGPLPEDLKASLLVHNGQRPPYMSEVLFNNEYLLPCNQIASTWAVRNEVADDLRGGEPSAGHTAEWWDPIFIPVTESDGSGFCVHRITGAVYYHNNSDQMTGPLFENWSTMLSDLATRVELGDFKLEHGSVWIAQ